MRIHLTETMDQKIQQFNPNGSDQNLHFQSRHFHIFNYISANIFMRSRVLFLFCQNGLFVGLLIYHYIPNGLCLFYFTASPSKRLLKENER